MADLQVGDDQHENIPPHIEAPAANNPQQAEPQVGLGALLAAFQSVSIGSRQVPTFDPAVDRINEFIVKFRASLPEASDADKQSKLAISLKGDALSWFAAELETGPAVRTFPEWEEALKKQFSKSSQTMCAELFANKQKDNQKPAEYYHATLRLCSAVEPRMTDEMKLMHLQRGLTKTLQKKMKLMKPKTPAEFLADLQSISDVELDKKEDTKKKLIEILTLQLSKEQAKKTAEVPIMFASDDYSNRRQERPYNPDVPRSRGCFKCGNLYHIAVNCPRRQPHREGFGTGFRGGFRGGSRGTFRNSYQGRRDQPRPFERQQATRPRPDREDHRSPVRPPTPYRPVQLGEIPDQGKEAWRS